MTSPLTVGSAIGKRGEKVSGFIDVLRGFDPETRIPVTVITGMSEGPVLALVAGIHGSEPSPIIALQRVRAEVDPARMRGAVILVHIANLPSFTLRTIYRGPWDQKNLNRVFPGRSDGTASDRIANAITMQVIEQCDCLVDMHSGDGNESLRPYSYWNKLGLDDAVDERAKQMALAFGLDHVVVDRGRPRDRTASIFCSNTAHLRGKPAVTTEAGGVGVPTESAIALNVQGAIGVMQHLEMLEGRRELVERPYWIDPSEVLTSPETGTWHPAVNADEHVAKGTLFGTVSNYFGETIAEVHAPMDGLVLYVVVSPAMGKGEPLGMIGQATREQ
jgi:predicted deacylase